MPSSREPRLRSVNDCDGHSSKYATDIFSKRAVAENQPAILRKSSASADRIRNQYWRL